MTKLTEADKVEVRTLFGNNPGMSYEDVAKVFEDATGRKLHRSTIMRIIKERDPTAGDTLPSKKRGRKGAYGATQSDNVAQRAPQEVIQEPPRTEALQAGARNEAQAIMRSLQALLEQETGRLAELDQAEKDLRDRSAGLPVQDKYELLSGLHKDWEKNREGMRQTLSDMAYLQKSLVMYIDNRQVHITANEDNKALVQLFLNEIVLPTLIEELPRSVGQAVSNAMTRKLRERQGLFERFGNPEGP